MAATLPEGFVLDPPKGSLPEGFTLDKKEALPSSERQFMSYNEFLRDESIPSEDRAVFQSQARKINASTYLSELSGVSVDDILANYESYSKAHGYDGNHEAD